VPDVRVRYIVDDVDAAAVFYTGVLGFEAELRPAPGFAMLRRGALVLLLNSPDGGGGAGHALSDGSTPRPGGWNRVQLPVEDLDESVVRVTQAGGTLRADPVDGRGGRQALVVDPSGNLVELFQPHG